ncbi:MAG TPA: molybdopterin-dependent oxidoreductase, partial [Chthoniobacterales bacterium]|nr:molybdopterin-dependent oxidoreductase [Chthoniobacterales bacterium]
RQTPRENDSVNSVWMCDYGRLNFHYVNSPERLTKPRVRLGSGQEDASWTSAIARAIDDLRRFKGDEIALIASGKMSNEELWLTKKLIEALDIKYHDIVPHVGESDDILLSSVRNPNLIGAHLLGVAQEEPGKLLPEIFQRVQAGSIKAVLALSEDLMNAGLTTDDLEKLEAFILLDILPNRTSAYATTLLPGYSFAEKRGSMVNIKGRLQRLNRAVHGPGEARDDWEILRDLLQKLTGSNGVYLIEDVFKQMAEGIPQLHGLSLSKIGDLGIQLEDKDVQTGTPENIHV